MARRFQSALRTRAPRRPTSWLTGPEQVDLSRTIVGNTIWATGLQILEDGVTLVRTRGQAYIRIAVSAAATDFMSGAMGIAIASENAFGAGVSSLMDPFNDSEWDGWLWHTFFHVGGSTGGTDAVQRFEIDGKAMRKIAALDVIYGVTRIQLEGGTVTAHTGADTRMLFKVS